jgi:hypothetical protein
MLDCADSAKLIEIYRNRHNISASGGLSDPAVATGISDLMYDSKEAHKETATMQSGIDPDLAMAWAAGLEDDVWANNTLAVDKVSLLCSVNYLCYISASYLFKDLLFPEEDYLLLIIQHQYPFSVLDVLILKLMLSLKKFVNPV